jgi:hypothetical protein
MLKGKSRTQNQSTTKRIVHINMVVSRSNGAIINMAMALAFLPMGSIIAKGAFTTTVGIEDTMAITMDTMDIAVITVVDHTIDKISTKQN